jgi:hypothetical protein
MKLKILLLGILMTCLQMVSLAQAAEEENLDTVQQKVWGITSSFDLGDTAWLALQQKTNAQFMSLVPTLAVIKVTFDSLEIKNNPQIIRLKYNYIYYNVSKQLKSVQLKAKKNKIKFKTCELVKIETKEGADEKGNPFAYITLHIKKMKREFTIKFVALKLNENWYIADELKLEFKEDEPYYKPPVKIKRKN